MLIFYWRKMIKHISSLVELDNYLSTRNTQNYNFVGYMWHEYGWFPFYFNELFSEFFEKKQGLTIGTCLPGHEFFYEDKVDELLVLDNFVNTENAYVNSQETDLFKSNLARIKDKGIAFWLTVRNFDEKEFESTLNKYKFKSILYPIGDTKTIVNTEIIKEIKNGLTVGMNQNIITDILIELLMENMMLYS